MREIWVAIAFAMILHAVVLSSRFRRAPFWQEVRWVDPFVSASGPAVKKLRPSGVVPASSQGEPAADSGSSLKPLVFSLETVERLGNQKPLYPEEALRKGWEGTSRLVLTLAQDGGVESVFLSQSSGHLVLDRAAQMAASRWQFPGVEGEVQVPVEFQLTD